MIFLQLKADYDNLTHNNSLLKQSYKVLKGKNKELEDELRSISEKHELLLQKTNQELELLKSSSSKGQMEDVNAKEKLALLTEEHKSLKEELVRLQTEHKVRFAFGVQSCIFNLFIYRCCKTFIKI